MAKPGFKKRAFGQARPPTGRIRQSQLVTTFGPGALLDLLDDAVIVGGLDFWRSAGEVIPEPRLRDAVAPIYAELKRPLSVEAPFRRPPSGDEQNPLESVGVQVYEFPRWFVCQNPKCGALVRANNLERKANHYVHSCGGAEDKAERCVPVRFVVACPKGHIDDIDWPWWLHDEAKCEAPQLRLDESVTGDFADVRVSCRLCGKTRHVIELMVTERAPRCSGERPWLGLEGREKCTEKQRLTVRTASNTYFSQVISALSIPEPESIRRHVQSVWDVLQAATPESLMAFRMIPKVKEALGHASDEDVLAAIKAERENVAEEVPELRTAEFAQFLQQPVEKAGELPPDDLTVQFWARRIESPAPLSTSVSRVVLARRLREVEAQLGFTRLEPATRDLQGSFELAVESAPLSLTRDWIPAVEIRGEGIFVQLAEEAVRKWEQREAVKKRTETLLAGFAGWAKTNNSKMAFPGARFYLLHSLSHFLITAVSLECGYPASSIRERLYCASPDDPTPMAAFLLSTGTTGAEGTLGGLVEEGRRLTHHLRRAFDDARLCSNDPVCAQHDPTGPDERHLEGAACHGCLFIPECSCERFNQFLDRALVFPTLGLEDVAFFPGEHVALDLTQVPTQVLERLRDAVEAGHLNVPTSALALRAGGFTAVVQHTPSLSALSREALLSVLGAVLNERLKASNPVELVWTGPETRTGESRDTAVVVQGLFSRAQSHVTIAGFRFDHGATLLSALHAAMRDRGVRCTIYADGPDAETLVKDNWPFGPPFPEVFGFVPPTGVYASLHAKCVVVDHRRVLVTSANFTQRGHERNIEVGIVLDDEATAQVLESQLHRLGPQEGLSPLRPPRSPP